MSDSGPHCQSLSFPLLHCGARKAAGAMPPTHPTRRAPPHAAAKGHPDARVLTCSPCPPFPSLSPLSLPLSRSGPHHGRALARARRRIAASREPREQIDAHPPLRLVVVFARVPGIVAVSSASSSPPRFLHRLRSPSDAPPSKLADASDHPVAVRARHRLRRVVLDLPVRGIPSGGPDSPWPPRTSPPPAAACRSPCHHLRPTPSLAVPSDECLVSSRSRWTSSPAPFLSPSYRRRGSPPRSPLRSCRSWLRPGFQLAVGSLLTWKLTWPGTRCQPLWLRQAR